MSVETAPLSDWLCASPGMVGSAVQERGTVVEQVELARETYRLRIACPRLAARIVPGQFFMLRAAGRNDPLLGRPFALYDVYDEGGAPAGIDVVYHVVGKMTGLMSGWSGGEPVELWGPLGNGFPLPSARHLVCVGGGIGYTPFLAVMREAAGGRSYGSTPRIATTRPERMTFCYGVRSRESRADLADFEKIPRLDIRIATDDGTEGHRGFVTDLLEQSLTPALSQREREDQYAVYCCGPEPMMHAVAKLCERRNVPCWLSLETPMACGFGACFSCVTRVKVDEDPGWDYRRTCVEGPIFNERTLALDAH
jgi:dihydroorotate dehydrogenase electron transfer subunit